MKCTKKSLTYPQNEEKQGERGVTETKKRRKKVATASDPTDGGETRWVQRAGQARLAR